MLGLEGCWSTIFNWVVKEVEGMLEQVVLMNKVVHTFTRKLKLVLCTQFGGIW